MLSHHALWRPGSHAMRAEPAFGDDHGRRTRAGLRITLPAPNSEPGPVLADPDDVEDENQLSLVVHPEGEQPVTLAEGDLPVRGIAAALPRWSLASPSFMTTATI